MRIPAWTLGVLMIGFLTWIGSVPAHSKGEGIRAYVAMGSLNQVLEIDIMNDKILRVFEAGVNPHGLAVTPDGRFLYAASRGSGPKKADHGKEGTEGKHHPLEAEKKAGQPEIDVHAGKATVIDIGSGEVVGRIDIGAGSHHAAVTRDGKYTVFTVPSKKGIVMVSTATRTIVRTVETGSGADYVLAGRDGKALYVSNKGDGTVTLIDTASWAVRSQIKVGQGPGHLAESPDGKTIYAVNSFDGTVSVIDAAGQRAISTFVVGVNPHGMDVRPDGKAVYVANRGGTTVTVYDTESKKTKEWTIGEKPYHLAVGPDGRKIYVGSRSLSKLWVLNIENGNILREIQTEATPHQIVFTSGSILKGD